MLVVYGDKKLSRILLLFFYFRKLRLNFSHNVFHVGIFHIELYSHIPGAKSNAPERMGGEEAEERSAFNSKERIFEGPDFWDNPSIFVGHSE